MDYRYQKINLFITQQQLLAERAHLGPAFNKNNYIVLKTNNRLNEGGAFGKIISLPMLIKIIRFGIDKYQESVIKEINKELYKRIDKRNLTSLFDEDSIEDKLVKEGISNEAALKIQKFFDSISHFIDEHMSSIERKSPAKTKDQKKRIKGRKERHDYLKQANNSYSSEGSVLKTSQIINEVLGAFQHGLHHIYQAITDYIGSWVVRLMPAKIRNSPERDSIIDIIGNLVFAGIVFVCLFSGGLAGVASSWGLIKSVEIFGEVCEICQTALGLQAVGNIIDTLKKVKKTTKENINSAQDQKIVQGIVSKDKLYSSSFDLSNISGIGPKTQKKHSSYAGTDYYGMPPSSNENLIRNYIKSILLESYLQ